MPDLIAELLDRTRLLFDLQRGNEIAQGFSGCLEPEASAKRVTLADEPWVGNRDWAIANNIRGFAGYPLAVKNRVLGVLATFKPLSNGTRVSRSFAATVHYGN